MLKPLIVIGAGGHASVLVDELKAQGREILALASPEQSNRAVLSGIPYIDDSRVIQYSSDDVHLVNGIGSLPGGVLRKELYKYYTGMGYHFESVIARSALVSTYAEISSGVQVLAGAIIQAGAKVSENSIVNTGARIDHDCDIGAHNHLAPGCVLSGQVKTGEGTHIGTGASVIQNIEIGTACVIAAGATVTQTVPNSAKIYGAKMIVK